MSTAVQMDIEKKPFEEKNFLEKLWTFIDYEDDDEAFDNALEFFVKLWGFIGLIAGAVIGFLEAGLGGVIVFTPAGGILGCIFGAIFTLMVQWWLRLLFAALIMGAGAYIIDALWDVGKP